MSDSTAWRRSQRSKGSTVGSTNEAGSPGGRITVLTPKGRTPVGLPNMTSPHRAEGWLGISRNREHRNGTSQPRRSAAKVQGRALYNVWHGTRGTQPPVSTLAVKQLKTNVFAP